MAQKRKDKKINYPALIGVGAMAVGSLLAQPFSVFATVERTSEYKSIVSTISTEQLHNPDRGYAIDLDVDVYNIDYILDELASEPLREHEDMYNMLTLLRLNLDILSFARPAASAMPELMSDEEDSDGYEEDNTGVIFSQANLAKLDRLFSLVRNQGLKVIVNYVYTENDYYYTEWEYTGYYTWEIVGVEQLLEALDKAIDAMAPILEQNKDIIALVEDSCYNDSYWEAARSYDATESAYTTKSVISGGYYYQSACSNISQNARYGLANSVIDKMPEGTRYNATDLDMAEYMSNLFSSKTNSVLGTDPREFVGLTNWYDYGVYDDETGYEPEYDLSPAYFNAFDSWAQNQGRYTFYGGNIRANSPEEYLVNAQKYHLSYFLWSGYGWGGGTEVDADYDAADPLNMTLSLAQPLGTAETDDDDEDDEEYYSEMEEFLNNVVLHTGYRLALQSSDVTVVNDDITVRVNLENLGFANINLPKATSLILKGDEITYKIATDYDIRTGLTDDDNYEIGFMAQLPSNFVAGNYSVYLKIEDQAVTLRNNTDYAIKFANVNTYDESLCANLLGEISIASTEPLPEQPKEPDNNAMPEAPKDEVNNAAELPDAGHLSKADTMSAIKVGGYSLMAFGTTILAATLIYSISKRHSSKHIIRY